VAVRSDWDLYLRMSRLGPFVAVDRQVAWYRRHAGNITNRWQASWFPHTQIRHRVWADPGNSPEQRRAAVTAWRRDHALLARHQAGLLLRAAAGGALRPAATTMAGLLLTLPQLLLPRPTRPGAGLVHWTRRPPSPVAGRTRADVYDASSAAGRMSRTRTGSRGR